VLLLRLAVVFLALRPAAALLLRLLFDFARPLFAPISEKCWRLFEAFAFEDLAFEAGLRDFEDFEVLEDEDFLDVINVLLLQLALASCGPLLEQCAGMNIDSDSIYYRWLGEDYNAATESRSIDITKRSKHRSWPAL